ncbi:MAG: hypothetical protein KJ620_01725 [Candidatus Edwardsbacteria bacterium]|nr:hypothetical protein [Candidatus Edwardsbacteria bacterium]MBU1577664.1 hypothetical protein [Candidatus Edwardsbacteria bacterium]MBU2464034.1 hypothetical protein [Candidatus Edwardsbacteria bacterium]MBU2593887.1 hypothetical protein [Candidatus Edwardsbacteria bacterium]
MDKENDLMALGKVFKPYRLLIALCGVILAAVGLFSQLALPKVYQGEAWIALPKISGAGSQDEDTILVSVAETRTVINLLRNRLRQADKSDLGSDLLLQKLRLARIDDVRGSDNLFKMIVQSQSDPQSTMATIDCLADYLKNNQYLMSRFEIKKVELETALLDVRLAVDRATKIKEEAVKLIRGRNNLGFNPVELETKMIELRERYNNIKAKLALAHSYQYVDRPYVRKNPISPRPWRNFFVFGFLGLLLGIMLSMMMHFIRTVIVTGVQNPES